MTNPRRQIRSLAAAHLIDGTRAGDRVHTSMPMPEDADLLPALLVHTRNPEKVTSHPPAGWNGATTRALELVVVGCIQAFYGTVDDDLDDFAEEIEAMFEAWVIPGFESVDIKLETTSSEVNWDPELPVGWVELSFSLNYRKAYRDCSNPYVLAGDDDIMRSGAYPGGRVTAGCPVGNTGEACPIGTANLSANGEPIN